LGTSCVDDLELAENAVVVQHWVLCSRGNPFRTAGKLAEQENRGFSRHGDYQSAILEPTSIS